MQIYFIDSDPEQAAKALINEHLSSQILDAAHILCNAHRVLDSIKSPTRKKYYLPDEREIIFYKEKNIKNSWSVWCRTRVENYIWLSDYLFALLDEYKLRFKKKHRILSFRKIDVGMPFMLQSPPYKLKEYEWTNPPLTIPDGYIRKKQQTEENFSLVDIVNSYRFFYTHSAQYVKPYVVGTYFNQPVWAIMKGFD
jgi:hypothetical protein